VWLAVSLAASLVACSKGGGGGPGGGTVTGAASSALDFLPKDTSLAIGINPGKLKDSKYYAMLTKGIDQNPEAKAALDAAKSCGLDWQTDFESIVIAGGGNLDKDRAIIIIKGNWDHDKLAKCAPAIAEKGGKKITVSKDGDLTVVQKEGEKPAYLAWPAKGVMMATPTSFEGDKAFLSDLMKKATSVKDNKVFMDLIGSTDTAAGVWFSGQLPDQQSTMMMSQLDPSGKLKLVGVYAALGLAKDFKGTVGLRLTGDPKPVADKLTTELDNAKKQLPPQYVDLMKDVTVSTAANDVVIKIGLTEKQIDTIVEMVGQFVPGFGGLGGGPPDQK
jgi:hypothetical protein